MLSGLAVMVSTPLLVAQLAREFHSSCWLPMLPWPLSPSALELSAHFVPQAIGPLKSSPNLYVHVPGTPTGIGFPVVGVDVVGVGVAPVGLGVAPVGLGVGEVGGAVVPVGLGYGVPEPLW